MKPWSLPAFLLVLVSACGNAPSSGGQDAGAEASTGADAAADGPSVAPKVVLVSHGAGMANVDVASLATQDYKGQKVVPLSAVWGAAMLPGDLSMLEFDFEGSDGFHPNSKAKCAVNMKGAQIGLGYILPDTRTLVWDDSLGLPGCYSVKDVVKVIALDSVADAGGG